MARSDKLTALANQAFKLVDTSREQLCLRPDVANPAQGLGHVVDHMRPGAIVYQGLNDDGTHNFSRDIKVNGSSAYKSNWTLTPAELVSEIRRGIKAQENVPHALALALNTTACNARWNPRPFTGSPAVPARG